MLGGDAGASVNSSMCWWSLILMNAMRTWSVPGLSSVVYSSNPSRSCQNAEGLRQVRHKIAHMRDAGDLRPLRRGILRLRERRGQQQSRNRQHEKTNSSDRNRRHRRSFSMEVGAQSCVAADYTRSAAPNISVEIVRTFRVHGILLRLAILAVSGALGASCQTPAPAWQSAAARAAPVCRGARVP